MSIVGFGTDIVEIARIEQQLVRSERLAARILTGTEMAEFQQSRFAARFLAKRFAAKEAVAKAVGTGIGRGIGFQQIEVLHHDSGQPYLQFSGELAALCERLGVTHSHISISDERHYALASVILEAR